MKTKHLMFETTSMFPKVPEECILIMYFVMFSLQQDQLGLADVVLWGSLHPLLLAESSLSGMYSTIICERLFLV